MRLSFISPLFFSMFFNIYKHLDIIDDLFLVFEGNYSIFSNLGHIFIYLDV